MKLSTLQRTVFVVSSIFVSSCSAQFMARNITADSLAANATTTTNDDVLGYDVAGESMREAGDVTGESVNDEAASEVGEDITGEEAAIEVGDEEDLVGDTVETRRDANVDIRGSAAPVCLGFGVPAVAATAAAILSTLGL